MMIDGEETRSSSYNIFIGVMRTNRKSNIIIIGEYYLNVPSSDDSFRHIEVPNSEMTAFVCDPESDREYFDVNIIDLNNSCAILLKKEVIIIGTTPDFQKYLDENGGDYDDSYLCVERFNFVRDITDFPFNRSSIDCYDLRFNEEMTSHLEKNDGGSRIRLDFTRTCRCSDDDCLTKLHWKTENSIWIDISNEEIRIEYTRRTNTYDRYVVDGTEYNDFPTIGTAENYDNFHHEITYDLFQKEDSKEEDD